jgi:hypothetical protein
MALFLTKYISQMGLLNFIHTNKISGKKVSKLKLCNKHHGAGPWLEMAIVLVASMSPISQTKWHTQTSINDISLTSHWGVIWCKNC